MALKKGKKETSRILLTAELAHFFGGTLVF